MLQKGFTLIELMIVVAIIGILSMFALPAYQDYTKRTYVSEGMALATAAKLAATEYFSTEGTWPDSNKVASLPAADQITGQSVDGIAIFHGDSGKSAATSNTLNDVSNIAIYYNTKVAQASGVPTTASDTTAGAGKGVLVIAPAMASSAGSVQWVCTKYGANSTDATGDIQKKWLPSNCRTQIDLQ